jgi:hypothetical protein
MIESIEDVREKDWATRDSHVVETASSRLFTAPVTGGYRGCRRCVGMVADGSDTELYTYG